jgi:pimeloyl-ACP methyl ester carboxylesterase
VHGFPTSSIDWFEAAEQLSGKFRVCALDFPGDGFSQKPRDWGYSLSRDAELLGYYLSEIVGARSATVVAHDRGDSVALIHAARCADGCCPVRLEHLVLTNANIFQQVWLEALAATSVPVTVIWGVYDTVSPPRVAMYVWDEYLMFKPGRNSLYFLPDANHYLQNDRPDAFVATVLDALESADDGTPGPINAAPGAPLLIDCSRERLPEAAEVLATGQELRDSG